MGPEMKNLCLKASALSTLQAAERVSFGKVVLYDTMFQSSTLAYIIQKQAGLYHEVSEKIIMPVVNRLRILQNLTDEVKIDEEYENLANIVRGLRTDIKVIVNKAREAFFTSLSIRINKLDHLWSNLTEAKNPEIQKEVDAVRDVIEELRKPEDLYDDSWCEENPYHEDCYIYV